MKSYPAIRTHLRRLKETKKPNCLYKRRILLEIIDYWSGVINEEENRNNTQKI